MRQNQIVLTITRIGDSVPSSYPIPFQIIKSYGDSDDVFEALCAAFSNAVCELAEYQPLGIKTYLLTNRDNTLSSKMLNLDSKVRLKKESLKNRLNNLKNKKMYIECHDKVEAALGCSATLFEAEQRIVEGYGWSQEQAHESIFMTTAELLWGNLENIQKEIIEIENEIEEFDNNNIIKLY